MMCSGPFRGASGTQQLARLHRKGPHRLEAWRNGPVQQQNHFTTEETRWFRQDPSLTTDDLRSATHRRLLPTCTECVLLKVAHSRWPAATAADPEKINKIRNKVPH